MQTDSNNTFWLDPSQRVSIHDLVNLSGLSENEILQLVDAGTLIPSDLNETTWTFSAECVVTVRKAARLRDDLELDPHALALTLTLLEQIRTLETELARLRAQRFYFTQS
jgi:chaperone modulatory protein CbpM